jgi:hypothetical protein
MHKYTQLREAGHSAGEIYRIAKEDGLDFAARIRLIRAEFGLSLAEAKEVMVIAEGWATSLIEYQEQLIPEIEAALEAWESEEDPSSGITDESYEGGDAPLVPTTGRR